MTMASGESGPLSYCKVRAMHTVLGPGAISVTRTLLIAVPLVWREPGWAGQAGEHDGQRHGMTSMGLNQSLMVIGIALAM